jgi:hypothetical protein
MRPANMFARARRTGSTPNKYWDAYFPKSKRIEKLGLMSKAVAPSSKEEHGEAK